MGAISVGGIYTGYIKGDKGDQGLIGQVGPMGMDGPAGEVGDIPTHEWNGTSIRFELPDGNWSDWIDLKGEKGDKGNTGATGAAGEDGADGIDLEPNCAPTIIYNTSDSHTEGNGTYNDYWYIINFSIYDVEEDNMEVKLWYRVYPSTDWKVAKIWPYQHNGSSFIYEKEIDGNFYWGDKTLEWLIQIQDGENLVYQPVSVTLTKYVEI